MQKEAEEHTTLTSSGNSNEDQEEEKEKQSGESDVDLEEMLEKFMEKTEAGQSYDKDTNVNNVQKDVAETVENTEPESDKKTETDLNNVEKDVAETVENTEPDINDKTETGLNNVENELDHNVETAMDTDIQKDTDDMPRRQIVTRSSAKINKKQEEDNMQMDDTDTAKPKGKINVHNVQKDTDKPRKPIITHSSANKVASKLVHKVKIKMKGSWEFVNNERAERAKKTMLSMWFSEGYTVYFGVTH